MAGSFSPESETYTPDEVESSENVGVDTPARGRRSSSSNTK